MIQILQELATLQVIAKYTGNNCRFMGISNFGPEDDIPDAIAALDAKYYLVANVKVQDHLSFIWGGTMKSINPGNTTNSNGMIVIYDYVNKKVVDSKPTTGDVKLGAG
ncbi:MAG: hypothetical protein ACJARP_001816 [Vicingaceae bacterium]|jgi:hypothetical protein